MNKFRILAILNLLIIFNIIPLAYGENEPPTHTTFAATDYGAYEKAPFANPKWDPFVKEGFEAMDKDNIPTTIEFLRKAVNLGCQSPLVLFKLALSYEALGSYYSAVQFYELAQEQFQKTNQDHRYYQQFSENYGRALYMMGQVDKAIPHLEKSVSSPSAPWVLPLLGQIFWTRGDYGKAAFYYERLLQVSPAELKPEDVLEINLKLARLYGNEGNTEKAIRFYENILRLDPQHQEAKDFVRKKDSSQNMNKAMERVMKIFN